MPAWLKKKSPKITNLKETADLAQKNCVV